MRVRAAWFQQLQRAAGSRKLEAGVGVLLLGLALFGGHAVDAIWLYRNQGVRLGGCGCGCVHAAHGMKHLCIPNRYLPYVYTYA